MGDVKAATKRLKEMREVARPNQFSELSTLPDDFKVFDVAIRALEASERWRLVPLEPNDDMIRAAYSILSPTHADIYRSMIAAAPEPEIASD